MPPRSRVSPVPNRSYSSVGHTAPVDGQLRRIGHIKMGVQRMWEVPHICGCFGVAFCLWLMYWRSPFDRQHAARVEDYPALTLTTLAQELHELINLMTEKDIRLRTFVEETKV